MKNTLIFLCVEGIGLNKQWKGNCLKLADKPNINHLISGIYPWSTLSNEIKQNKLNTKKEFNSVSTDIDKNFYQMLHGNSNIQTLNEKISNLITNKEFANLELFNVLLQNAEIRQSKYVHVFFMLSDNKSHYSIENFKYTLNVLVKKGLKPVIHLIADGKEDRFYSFEKHVREIEQFLIKKNIQIASITGRNHAFIGYGRDYKDSKNVLKYFDTLCGLSNKTFTTARDYVNNNLSSKTRDQDIEPAYNEKISKCFIEDGDSLLFLDSDYDNYSALVHLIENDEKFKHVVITSAMPIYGSVSKALMFNEEESISESITNVASKNNLTSLVLSLNHKKGFVTKFYGSGQIPNVTKKVIKMNHSDNNLDYIFSANKLLTDATLKAVGKYDFIVVHVPTIAEAAHEGNLKLLKFAIENFDKNLGKIINYSKVTGNVIAFASPYGSSEKMLNKKLEIIPYNKNSIVPFVFTNGDLSSRRLHSNFVGLYSTILMTLGVKNLTKEQIQRSLITDNYNKDIIRKKLEDQYQIWYEVIAKPLIDNFDYNSLSLYEDMNKDANYISKKQQFIVLKQLINLHGKIFTTSEARKMLFDRMLNHVVYNKIDFEGFKYDLNKTVMTLFDNEIKLSRMVSATSRFFDNYLWKTNIKRNDKWFTKVKNEIIPSLSRNITDSVSKKIIKDLEISVEPYQFFERIIDSEKKILSSNDAHKITDFYESIKGEVDEVFNKYFANKLNSEVDELTITDDEPVKNLDHDKISTYYDSFNEVVNFVIENKGKADLYNRKYLENVSILKSSVNENVFEANQYELNYLVRRIVGIYEGWKRTFKVIKNEQKREFDKSMNKYNINYNRRYENAVSSIAYDGEFFDNIDLENQDNFEIIMNEKVKECGFFDVPSMDIVEKDVVESLFINDIWDENGDVVVDKIEDFISTKSEYDRTHIWNKKRYEEINNIDNIRYDFAADADQIVNHDRKVKGFGDKLIKYNNLSNTWNKKISDKDI